MSQQPQCELYKDQSSFKVSADTYTHTGKLRKFKKKGLTSVLLHKFIAPAIVC